MSEPISKVVVKTTCGKQVTVYDVVYINGVLYGWNLHETKEYSIPVSEIKSKRVSWIWR